MQRTSTPEKPNSAKLKPHELDNSSSQLLPPPNIVTTQPDIE